MARSADGKDWARLDFAGFAQEFLRRNPAYRADWHRRVGESIAGRASDPGGPARRWGLSVLLSIRIVARSEAPALWHIAAAATVVALGRAPIRYPGARSADPGSLIVAERLGPDGRHLIIDARGERHRLWLPEEAMGMPLVVLLPTADLPSRVAAAERGAAFARRPPA